MWSLIWKWTVAKVLFRSFGWLALLIPVALMLKGIGLPLLLILGGLAMPVLIMLAIVGLPIIAVLVVGGVIMSVLGVVVTVGLTLAKIVIPILLLVWFVNFLFGGCNRTKGSGEIGTDPA